MPVKHDSRSLIGPIPAVRTQNHQKSGDNEIGFADNCVANIGITGKEISIDTKEGANKQVISSQADSLIKISRIWADFFPANTSNQPI